MEITKENKHIFAMYCDAYLEKGYSVIPCKYGSKMPAIKNWSEYCYRKPTSEEIASWKENFTETNIDICMGEASGVVALDIDSTDQRILDVIMPMLPDSPVVKIGSKGETRFFRYTGEMSETLKFNGEMVMEVLSTNKKTTIPPSRHPNGLDYKYKSTGLMDLHQAALPILPPALFSHVASTLRTTFPDLIQEGGKLISGRNDELSSLCGSLIQEKLPIDDAVNKLIAHDKEINDPPLFSDPNEFRHTESVTNALMFYSNHLSTINNRHYRDSKEYEIPIMTSDGGTSLGKPQREEPKNTKNLSDIMSLAPTVLKTLHTTLLNNSWVKQPDLALGAILTLGATLVSRKVIFQGLSPNLYVLNISTSGSGKDKPQSFVKEILINMRADSLLGAGDYVSDASLMDSLANNPVRLDIMDEAGGILRSVNSGKAEYNGKMADVLAELYTSSNTKYLGRQTAEGNKGACYRPNVNILASTTPTGFSEGVTRKSIEKGLMGRFIIFLGNADAPAERLKSFPKVPNSVIERLRFWYGFRVEDYAEHSEFELGGIKQTFIELDATDEANALLDEVFEEFDLKRRSMEPTSPTLPIVARLYQQMVKLVIISACMRSTSLKIEKSDVLFAKELILYYNNNVEEVVDKYIFENRTQMNSQKILNVIKSHGGVITKTKLYKKTRSLTKKEREAILEDLLESGLISRDRESMDGQQKIVFRSL